MVTPTRDAYTCPVFIYSRCDMVCDRNSAGSNGLKRGSAGGLENRAIPAKRCATRRYETGGIGLPPTGRPRERYPQARLEATWPRCPNSSLGTRSSPGWRTRHPSTSCTRWTPRTHRIEQRKRRWNHGSHRCPAPRRNLSRRWGTSAAGSRRRPPATNSRVRPQANDGQCRRSVVWGVERAFRPGRIRRRHPRREPWTDIVARGPPLRFRPATG